ncbi:phage tail assembly chaperone [Methylobacterium sp. J-067]|uniref:phage tail assembly chaperone n=1 Tax=Methylobacterium sp. J-067 TaxID=2836648 RepID=UPI001FB8B5C2|nr:hypothetical protein [Methylobacterium sp. J-067]MCJ2023927.1 hypothetical protein [Methylobacterium sp. J-067]
MATEFEIAGNRYRFNGMPAQVETRIARRLAPLIAEAVPLILKPGRQIAIRSDVDAVTIAKAALGQWGTLSDENLDYIERAALGALSRETAGQWVPVWPKGSDEPAFNDINGAVMQIATASVLGFVVKQWIDGDGAALPAEIRDVMQNLH